MSDKETKYVPWLTFGIVVTVAMLVIGGAYAYAQSSMSLGQNNALDIRELQTQYRSIDSSLIEIKGLLKK